MQLQILLTFVFLKNCLIFSESFINNQSTLESQFGIFKYRTLKIILQQNRAGDLSLARGEFWCLPKLHAMRDHLCTELSHPAPVVASPVAITTPVHLSYLGKCLAITVTTMISPSPQKLGLLTFSIPLPAFSCTHTVLLITSFCRFLKNQLIYFHTTVISKMSHKYITSSF